MATIQELLPSKSLPYFADSIFIILPYSSASTFIKALALYVANAQPSPAVPLAPSPVTSMAT